MNLDHMLAHIDNVRKFYTNKHEMITYSLIQIPTNLKAEFEKYHHIYGMEKFYRELEIRDIELRHTLVTANVIAYSVLTLKSQQKYKIYEVDKPITVLLVNDVESMMIDDLRPLNPYANKLPELTRLVDWLGSVVYESDGFTKLHRVSQAQWDTLNHFYKEVLKHGKTN